jgi:hypothetical protein
MLDYAALGILIFAGITVFYGIIVIHDIPYEIAVHRNHPHQDAIHYAGWISLFTLHVLWPFLWIWATLYREDRGWGMIKGGNGDEPGSATLAQVAALAEAHSATLAQLAALEGRLEHLEQSPTPSIEDQQASGEDEQSSSQAKD